MMISDLQARLALECLREAHDEGESGVERVSKLSPELLERVNRVLAEVPETRRDRVEQARAGLAEGICSSREVAEKIIARVISDSLR